MTKEKKDVGRPLHVASDDNKTLVYKHSVVGTPQEIIADILCIDVKTLRKHYREQLDQAVHIANSDVGGTLYRKAMDGDTTAMIFWLKTRAKWSENKDSDSNQKPITINFVDAQKQNAD